MGIVRVAKNSNYVVMNRTALNDKRLSWKAKGIMAYLLSMPDDWVFYTEELMTHAADGRDSFRSGFNELKKAGYVERKPIKDEVTKKIKEWETIVHEIPIEPLTDIPEVEKPLTGNPQTEKPQVENPTLLSTDINQVLNKPNIDINQVLTDKDIGTEKQSSVNQLSDPNFLEIKQLYESNVRVATFRDCQAIDEAMEVYEPALILEAIKAGASSARSFKYILGILDNWRLEFNVKTYADWQKKIQPKGGQPHGDNQRPNASHIGKTPEEIAMLERLRTYSSNPIK